MRVSEVTTKRGIPVTTPTRVILDLAGVLSARELEQLVSEAFAIRLTNRPSLLRIIERHAQRRGVRALRALLEAGHAPARTRSPPEERLLMLLRAAGLPEPEVNARLEPWEVDFLWREERLVVEVDGYASHSSPEAFERDRRKTAELQDAGFLVHRVTAKAVQGDPGSAVATIGRMVDRARVRPGQ